MKRTPLKKIGEIGKRNFQSRKMIADICESLNLNYCEVRLDGCLGNFALAPAHRKRRSEYKSAEELADYKEWICACQVCHARMDRRTPEANKLTEYIFKRLR